MPSHPSTTASAKLAAAVATKHNRSTASALHNAVITKSRTLSFFRSLLTPTVNEASDAPKITQGKESKLYILPFYWQNALRFHKLEAQEMFEVLRGTAAFLQRHPKATSLIDTLSGEKGLDDWCQKATKHQSHFTAPQCITIASAFALFERCGATPHVAIGSTHLTFLEALRERLATIAADSDTYGGKMSGSASKALSIMPKLATPPTRKDSTPPSAPVCAPRK